MTLRPLYALSLAVALLVMGQSCAHLEMANAQQPIRLSATDPKIEYSGRWEVDDEGRVLVGYSGARARLRFEGTSLTVLIDDDSGENYAQAWVDGERQPKFRLDSEDGRYLIAEGLAPGEHTVEIMRITECFLGLTRFGGFLLPAGGEALEWGSQNDRKIEFIGDSITCGYGVEVDDPSEPFKASTENFSLGYSGLTARALDADFLVVSRSGIGMVRNYDGPREGSENTMPDVYPNTFYLNDRYQWDFERFVPDVVCINLGTNDFSTTGVDAERFVSSYVDFAAKVLERYDDAQLVVLQGPMNNHPELRAALESVLAKITPIAPDRISFLELSAQGSVGFGASYHPNRAQSRINAAELTAFLSDLMGWE
ncbi:SGNH/GDSL hydrolase family protein [Pelagicoccus sp. SDUM812003]|uniref:SGNH/GDSL hydrolase family protein n=1 Tax=Pelagicoccus sp. SDUM812003 TaxID=3041267 RepID=UPI00280F0AF0|nr:SGNH/GDSL hydrolase family protein [Pelagicoccus sp. SDUM812003]MDQ8201836.1 SGNH/GDSL hydrolase family protein [Pelagicoccus sp. SDUM812003]